MVRAGCRSLPAGCPSVHSSNPERRGGAGADRGTPFGKRAERVRRRSGFAGALFVVLSTLTGWLQPWRPGIRDALALNGATQCGRGALIASQISDPSERDGDRFRAGGAVDDTSHGVRAGTTPGRMKRSVSGTRVGQARKPLSLIMKSANANLSLQRAVTAAEPVFRQSRWL
jgi:hypothetical protein